jgi:hypothetical protein
MQVYNLAVKYNVTQRCESGADGDAIESINRIPLGSDSIYDCLEL